MKIAYNTCYGGFGLSQEALKWMAERGHAGATEDLANPYGAGTYFDRDDKLLIECIETIGSKAASWAYAKLDIYEIPDGANWEIDEYDGRENVVPPRQSW